MYTLDTKTDPKYFLIVNNETGKVLKAAKSVNTVEQLKKHLGKDLKEII